MLIPENFMHPLYRVDSDPCLYYLLAYSNFNFLHNSQWITFPTQSYLLLFSFGVCLLLSLIMRLTICQHSQILISCPIPSVSRFPLSHTYSCTSLVPVGCSYSLHLLFCCVISFSLEFFKPDLIGAFCRYLSDK